MHAPVVRPRRLRRTPALRELVAEVRTAPADLVLPLFVKEGLDGPSPVASLPGVAQHTPDSATALTQEALDAGVRAVILFGVPAHKDDVGSSGWASDGPVPTTARALRAAFGDDVVVWADVCSCEYTSHGHCGPLRPDGLVDNDAAVAGYVRESLVYVEAGCDVVAPSGMMDGQVLAIRTALDDAGHHDAVIVAYAAKYASAHYGPFRDAAESGMAHGDRRHHQMDPRNRSEALREVALDVAEGADVVMVKPALPYLDVVADAAAALDVPVAAYQVSGEYAMARAAGERGWVDAGAVLEEQVTSIRRAGADLVLTYAAVELARRWGG